MQRRYGDLTLADTGLTARGWEQSSALAAWLLQHEEVDTLICSDQLRSRLTAQRIGQVFGLVVQMESKLPQSPRRNWSLHPPAPQGSSSSNGDSLPLQSESKGNEPGVNDSAQADMQKAEEERDYRRYELQLVDALNQILKENSGKTTVVVTNASAIATIIRHLCGGHRLGIAIDDTSINELALVDDGWQLIYTNRREHLPKAPISREREKELTAADGSLRDQIDLIRRTYNQLAVPVDEESNPGDVTVGLSQAQFLKFIGFEAGQRLLDVGAGSGRLALALAEAGAREVIGVDVSPTMLEQAEYLRLRRSERIDLLRRVSFRLAPAHHLPFGNETFDAILCRAVLHHLPKLDQTLLEFQRVLRPDGRLIIAELVGSDDPVKRATQNAIESKRNPSHSAIRTLSQLRDALASGGFTVADEQVVVVERNVGRWLHELAVEPGVRQAVREMLEASIETDAAELNVRRTADGDLVFEQKIVYMRATL